MLPKPAKYVKKPAKTGYAGFYNRFIKPPAGRPEQFARQIVLNYLLVGMFTLAFASLLNTVIVFVQIKQTYELGRILGVASTALAIAGLYLLARYSRFQKAVAILLVGLFGLIGGWVALQWGVLNTNAMLLMGLTVVMSGILISARSSLYVTGAAALTLVGLQYAETHGLSHPNLTWLDTKPTDGDVIGFSTILFCIALVSWLFNRQMESALEQARRYELALVKQRDNLEITVQKRTQQLEATQLEQMRELYRFAELGRLSTALFHDLSNHLATVSVDLEGLNSKRQTAITRRLQDNVKHVDVVVQRVRQQLQGKTTIEVFNVADEVQEVVNLLGIAAGRAGVTIDCDVSGIKKGLLLKGDVIRFRQIILNLVTNGIEAYAEDRQPGEKRAVNIVLTREGRMMIIDVSDRGMGIPLANLTKVFEPFYSTKPKGVGIGLFIVKQVVETVFGGEISIVNNSGPGTTFRISLPRAYYAKSASS